jgi:hypothetical protein
MIEEFLEARKNFGSKPLPFGSGSREYTKNKKERR